ncbi:MAG: MATE family efflux transporter [Proteobacteria bacterium]|nr:MATE family efflux transporter [Pseudomonadota bacterium]MBU1596040.1 MATE family efflux transporter [Pseudomonadota bacterium]
MAGAQSSKWPDRWQGPGGYREALAIGAPLMVSMGSYTLMQFTDRVFLGRHSASEIAASVPAGIASFLFIGFFMGVASCVSVLVAQYAGACRPERVGPALWQGVWFSLAAAAILAGLAFLGGPIFAWAGHPAQVRALEADYFFVLTLGGGFMVLSTALSSYFSGLERTVPVMLVNLAGAALNIPLDYALIFGKWGAPELGIHGAALATVAGSAIICLFFFALILLSPEARLRHRIAALPRPEPEMLLRLLRIGLPAGVQFFLDILALTGFSLLVGRLGMVELSATNIAFSINSLTYLPVIGLSIAASILVGRSQGQKRPDIAQRATGNILRLSLGWMWMVGLVFVLLPGPLLDLFETAPGLATLPGDPAFADIRRMGVVLLRYVALYSLIDGVSIVYFGALKGAGDTRFVMLTMLAASVGVLILPAWALVESGTGGIHAPWLCLTAYIAALACAFALRFRGGHWRRIKVIEEAPGPAGGTCP